LLSGGALDEKNLGKEAEQEQAKGQIKYMIPYEIICSKKLKLSSTPAKHTVHIRAVSTYVMNLASYTRTYSVISPPKWNSSFFEFLATATKNNPQKLST
jgi:hypothetical protein